MIGLNIEKNINRHKNIALLKVKATFNLGSNIAVLGPSGIGKTTFLKIFGGLVTPDRGTIFVGGQKWNDTNTGFTLPAKKRKVGFVFQDYALFPHLTVERHLRYGTKDEAYLKKLLTIMKLEGLEKHLPHQLSGGQQQRLAIARALSTRPSVLLMDEPFSAQDKAMKKEIIGELCQLQQELSISSFIATHYAEEVTGIIDQVLEIV